MNEAHNISLFEKSKIRPLADMLRPKKFEEMVGMSMRQIKSDYCRESVVAYP